MFFSCTIEIDLQKIIFQKTRLHLKRREKELNDSQKFYGAKA